MLKSHWKRTVMQTFPNYTKQTVNCFMCIYVEYWMFMRDNCTIVVNNKPSCDDRFVLPMNRFKDVCSLLFMI